MAALRRDKNQLKENKNEQRRIYYVNIIYDIDYRVNSLM